MALLPYRRLTGYWDNGLRWKVPEDKLKKFVLITSRPISLSRGLVSMGTVVAAAPTDFEEN